MKVKNTKHVQYVENYPNTCKIQTFMVLKVASFSFKVRMIQCLIKKAI